MHPLAFLTVIADGLPAVGKLKVAGWECFAGPGSSQLRSMLAHDQRKARNLRRGAVHLELAALSQDLLQHGLHHDLGLCCAVLPLPVSNVGRGDLRLYIVLFLGHPGRLTLDSVLGIQLKWEIGMFYGRPEPDA